MMQLQKGGNEERQEILRDDQVELDFVGEMSGDGVCNILCLVSCHDVIPTGILTVRWDG